jgi:hypothetical protein
MASRRGWAAYSLVILLCIRVEVVNPFSSECFAFGFRRKSRRHSRNPHCFFWQGGCTPTLVLRNRQPYIWN